VQRLYFGRVPAEHQAIRNAAEDSPVQFGDEFVPAARRPDPKTVGPQGVQDLQTGLQHCRHQPRQVGDASIEPGPQLHQGLRRLGRKTLRHQKG